MDAGRLRDGLDRIARAQFRDDFGDPASPHAAQFDYSTGAVPGGGFWTGVHNPANGGNASMPSVFVADGFDSQGNNKAGKLVIEDFNKHENTDGSMGIGWEPRWNNAPFLYREVPSTMNCVATMKINAQSDGLWSYSPMIARFKGTPPHAVGLGPGDALDPHESFVTTGRVAGSTFVTRSIRNAHKHYDVGETIVSGTPLWIRMFKVFSEFRTSYSFDGVTFHHTHGVTNPFLHQYGETLQIGPSFMMFGGDAGRVEIDFF